jgi:TonB family protein
LRLFFSTLVLLAFCVVLTAQQKTDTPKDSGEIYTVGGDVKPPKILHYVEPEPSEQETYVEGTVKIAAVINLDGTPSDLHVVKGLNDSEDKLALEALKQWRFSPGTKDGRPVRVRINVEINFHLL